MHRHVTRSSVPAVVCGPAPGESSRASSPKLLMAEAGHEVVIDHAGSLHVRIADRGPHKGKAAFPQVFAHGIRLGSFRRNFFQGTPHILDGLSSDKAPDVLIEAAELR